MQVQDKLESNLEFFNGVSCSYSFKAKCYAFKKSIHIALL